VQIWIIAAGHPNRDYSSVFLKHDVMFMGPSMKLGNALNAEYAGSGMSIENQTNRFAKAPMAGDRIILRVGKEIVAVGEIPDASQHDVETGYQIDPTFYAVLGWELGHSRRVLWSENIKPSADLQTYVDGYRQMATFFQIQDAKIIKEISALSAALFDRKLKPMPDPNEYKEYSWDELAINLFNSGISNQSVESIIKALEQARRLNSWYHIESEGGGRYPTEHEVVSHMVLPFLLALGWSHQQIAVEWNKVDIALFGRTPTDEKNCRIVIEVKGLGKEIAHVLEQPLGYVENLKLTNVDKIVVTDGKDFYIYEKNQNGTFNQECSGYLNVSRLQEKYILPYGTDVLKTIGKLRP
jgi:hypothetical protein